MPDRRMGRSFASLVVLLGVFSGFFERCGWGTGRLGPRLRGRVGPATAGAGLQATERSADLLGRGTVILVVGAGRGTAFRAQRGRDAGLGNADRQPGRGGLRGGRGG